MTSALKIIDQELAQFGWVESIATNSISDFKSPKIDIKEQTINEKESDLIDTFICHLIFYVIFAIPYFYMFLLIWVLHPFKKVNTLFKLPRIYKIPFF